MTSIRYIPEPSNRCPNIQTVVPSNNLVLRVPCRPPIVRGAEERTLATSNSNGGTGHIPY